MQIEFLLNESFKNQNRKLIRTLAQNIVSFMKKTLKENPVEKLLSINVQSNSLRCQYLTGAYKPALGDMRRYEYFHQNDFANITLLINYKSDENFFTNIHGSAGSEYGSKNIKIIMNVSLVPNSDNYELYIRDLPFSNKRLYEVLTHEMEHIKQINRKDEDDTHLPYTKRKSEIEAYSKGLLRKYRMFIGTIRGSSINIDYKDFIWKNLRLQFGNSLSQIEFNLFFNEIIKYIEANHPTYGKK